jgi:phosphatidylserine/phosphatidylglycerophosphate/cardiolipin synthase-like enzyme
MWRFARVPFIATLVLFAAGGAIAVGDGVSRIDAGGGRSARSGAESRNARLPLTTIAYRRPLSTYARFNRPTGSARQRTVISRNIRKFIRGAAKGSTISVSLFHFISRPMAKEFIRAKRRGVHVRIVLNSDNRRYKAYKQLRTGLGRNIRKKSWVLLCPGGRGCIAPQWRGKGRSGVNHNKYFLFSKTSGHRNVVVQASGNLTWWADAVQWNNSLTFANRRIYAAYLRYFWDQARRRTTPDYRRWVTSGRTTVHFFPRRRDDPLVNGLRTVSCAGASRIRVAVGYLTWRPLARRLRALAAAGCPVEVITTGLGKSAARLFAKGGVPRPLKVRHTPDRVSKYLVHSKYMLVDGSHRGRRQRVVYTGSNNYTAAGFRKNDEVLVVIADGRLHQDYLRNFRTVWRTARPFPFARSGRTRR